MAKKKAKALSPAEQKRKMIERYGTESQWVEVPVYLTHQEMIDFFGKKCKDYEPLCACCSAWLMWNKTGKAELLLEREEIIKIMSK